MKKLCVILFVSQIVVNKPSVEGSSSLAFVEGEPGREYVSSFERQHTRGGGYHGGGIYRGLGGKVEGDEKLGKVVVSEKGKRKKRFKVSNELVKNKTKKLKSEVGLVEVNKQ